MNRWLKWRGFFTYQEDLDLGHAQSAADRDIFIIIIKIYKNTYQMLFHQRSKTTLFFVFYYALNIFCIIAEKKVEDKTKK